ncbi:hypothetical protein [Candidatus Aciduliprofundum boonei]|uniref:Uncharacterized protein n=1 Tax=Aciduliprofundum boonei (strain DSM 19572 / T469) TaxID=439481 RepID=D3T9T2_ACIB4|nr:hypothetical protein [Candidatus Aciduliprofundum boonei]ADD08861.1 hypothetical protein Aboo_1052 [Aciduliprofundum boonei T469]HII55614.1 hypothetical protein [Candidatus Aciduliprofundum boonei]
MDMIDVFLGVMQVDGGDVILHFNWDADTRNLMEIQEEFEIDGKIYITLAAPLQDIGTLKDYGIINKGNKTTFNDTVNKILERWNFFKEKLKNGEIEMQILAENPFIVIDDDKRFAFFLFYNIIFLAEIIGKYRRKETYKKLRIRFSSLEYGEGELDGTIKLKVKEIDTTDNEELSSALVEAVLKEEGDI